MGHIRTVRFLRIIALEFIRALHPHKTHAGNALPFTVAGNLCDVCDAFSVTYRLSFSLCSGVSLSHALCGGAHVCLIMKPGGCAGLLPAACCLLLLPCIVSYNVQQQAWRKYMSCTLYTLARQPTAMLWLLLMVMRARVYAHRVNEPFANSNAHTPVLSHKSPRRRHLIQFGIYKTESIYTRTYTWTYILCRRVVVYTYTLYACATAP